MLVVSEMFQFHEGPIKTLQHVARSSYAGEFQFHEGPIKTLHTIRVVVS